MEPQNIFQTFFTVYNSFAHDLGFMFVDKGKLIFDALSIAMISWFGIQTALSSGEHHGGLSWVRFVKLLAMIAICKYMVYYYQDFIHIVLSVGKYIALKININLDDKMIKPMVELINGMEKPSVLNWLHSLFYFLMYIVISLLSVVAFYVIALGYIAIGIFVMLGPFFVPLFIVPKLDMFFWGWLKGLVQYSFYPAVTYAFLYVLSEFITASNIYGNLSVTQMFYMFPTICIVFLAGIFSIFKIPTIVNHLFSGISGTGTSVIPFTGGK